MKDKISIIVPIYNSESCLNTCIESLINQTYSNIEILLVNDGSTDNSEKICKEYMSKDIRITYLHQKNSGVSNARNLGIDKSKGEYILFVDSDDYISNNYIENIYNKMKKNKCEIAVTGLTEVTPEGKIIKQIKYTIEDKKMRFSDFIDDFINYAYFTCVKMLFKKEILKDVRFIPKLKYGEDMFFSYNLFKSYDILYVSNTDYFYVQNNNSLTHKVDIKNLEKYMEDNFYMLSKVLSDYPEKKIIINNRLLSKLNIAASRYMTDKNYIKKDIKRFIKNYRKKITNIKLKEIDYLGLISKIKLFLLKYNLINIYIFICKFGNKLNKKRRNV